MRDPRPETRHLKPGPAGRCRLEDGRVFDNPKGEAFEVTPFVQRRIDDGDLVDAPTGKKD